METTTENFLPYKKKIMPYLDGSLSADEKSEFEAFVVTHPEFESQVKTKQGEIALIRSLIPATLMSRDSEVTLENEIKSSVFNLLRVEPRSWWDNVKNTCEDWISR